jgi:hypothetical protein
LGRLYRSLGKNDDALRCFEQAWKLNSTAPGVAYNLALILRQRGDPRAAAMEQTYRRLLAGKERFTQMRLYFKSDSENAGKAVALAQSEEAKVTPAIPADGGENAGGADSGEPGEAGAGGQPALELPSLRARPLAALPAGTVNIGRSILMVLTGCLGGAAYRDLTDTSACGADYAPASPTVQPLVVKLSRDVGYDKVGLQAVHASLPTGSVDVRASGDAGAVSLVFASDVTFGAIAPRPADIRFTPVELGVAQANYGLQAVAAGGDVVFQEAWPDILAASGIDALVAARTYTAIFLGPDPLLIKIGWWNKSAFALVDNDPTRKE